LALLETIRVGEVSLVKLLRRPEITWTDLAAHLPELAQVPHDVAAQIQCDSKYAGYVARQDVEVSRLQRLQGKRIPTTFDYSALRQLRTEAREKFAKVRPISLAQASRISGITPADVAVLLVHLSAD
jgi:tRNA uridine 5-carboxymethylaminomethyl modification enzyme